MMDFRTLDRAFEKAGAHVTEDSLSLMEACGEIIVADTVESQGYNASDRPGEIEYEATADAVAVGISTYGDSESDSTIIVVSDETAVKLCNTVEEFIREGFEP